MLQRKPSAPRDPPAGPSTPKPRVMPSVTARSSTRRGGWGLTREHDGGGALSRGILCSVFGQQ